MRRGKTHEDLRKKIDLQPDSFPADELVSPNQQILAHRPDKPASKLFLSIVHRLYLGGRNFTSDFIWLVEEKLKEACANDGSKKSMKSLTMMEDSEKVFSPEHVTNVVLIMQNNPRFNTSICMFFKEKDNAFSKEYYVWFGWDSSTERLVNCYQEISKSKTIEHPYRIIDNVASIRRLANLEDFLTLDSCQCYSLKKNLVNAVAETINQCDPFEELQLEVPNETSRHFIYNLLSHGFEHCSQRLSSDEELSPTVEEQLLAPECCDLNDSEQGARRVASATLFDPLKKVGHMAVRRLLGNR